MPLGSGYEDGWVLANGVKTHYWWAGTNGKPVILVHGAGPGSSGEAGFRFMLPVLAAAGYRVIAPDQISMGWTDARPHAWPILGHQSLVNHVRDFVEALCLDEVAVVGNSQGAYVAAKYAIDNPEKVSKAFFIGSATIGVSMGIEHPPNAGLQALREYDYTADGMRKFLLAIVNDESKVTDELVAVRQESALRPGIRESRAAFDGYRDRMAKDPKLVERFSLADSMPKFSIPAKFIWGNEDRFAPVSIAHQLEKLLPNIPFDYVSGGHQAQNDNPEVVNQMVIDFLAQ